MRLRQEVLALRHRVDRIVALLRLMTLLLKVSGFSLAKARLPDGAAKARLLAGASLATWIALIAAGRYLAYTHKWEMLGVPAIL